MWRTSTGKHVFCKQIQGAVCLCSFYPILQLVAPNKTPDSIAVKTMGIVGGLQNVRVLLPQPEASIIILNQRLGLQWQDRVMMLTFLRGCPLKPGFCPNKKCIPLCALGASTFHDISTTALRWLPLVTQSCSNSRMPVRLIMSPVCHMAAPLQNCL